MATGVATCAASDRSTTATGRVSASSCRAATRSSCSKASSSASSRSTTRPTSSRSMVVERRFGRRHRSILDELARRDPGCGPPPPAGRRAAASRRAERARSGRTRRGRSSSSTPTTSRAATSSPPGAALRGPAGRRGAGPLHRAQLEQSKLARLDRGRLLLRLPRQRVRPAGAVRPPGVRRGELRGARVDAARARRLERARRVTEDTDLTLRLRAARPARALRHHRRRHRGEASPRSGASGVSGTGGPVGTSRSGATTAVPCWHARRLSSAERIETTMFLLVYHVPVVLRLRRRAHRGARSRHRHVGFEHRPHPDRDPAVPRSPARARRRAARRPGAAEGRTRILLFVAASSSS